MMVILMAAYAIIVVVGIVAGSVAAAYLLWEIWKFW